MYQKTTMATALALAFAALQAPAQAQTLATGAQTNPQGAGIHQDAGSSQSDIAAAQQLKQINVRASRSGRDKEAQALTQTQLEQEQIERAQSGRLSDLFSQEVDLSIRAATPRFTAAGSAGGRAGQEGINIRGLEGNQVLLLIDGVRMPDSFAFGAFATGRGDFLNIDALKAVEVLRGPASVQHGSDGLAGAVSFTTIDPDDILQGQHRFGGFAKAGYSSLDKSWQANAALAWRNQDWQHLIFVGQRQGHEVANQADGQFADVADSRRTKPNPLSFTKRSLLTKSYWQVQANQRLGLSLEALRQELDSQVLSARALAPYGATSVIGLTAHDQISRDKISLEHRWQLPQLSWLQQLESRLSYQQSRATQLSLEDRYTAADRVRDNEYKNQAWYFSSAAQGKLAELDTSYGVDWSRAEISALRNGTVPPAGESFPARPFPITQYNLLGAFWQADWQTGALTLSPGLRYDQYRLSPKTEGYQGKIVKLSDSALTPRLGLLWQVQPGQQAYLNLARGFRAPTPDQVNNGFSNPVMGYATVGNPDLKAETARSTELGWRGRIAGLRYQLAAYRNHYDDFISQQQVRGSGSAQDPMIFQYINLQQATIRGTEARLDWQLDQNWRWQAGYAQSRGEVRAGGSSAPLETINPARLQSTLTYQQVAWSVYAQLQHQRGKALADIPAGAGTSKAFAPAAYTTLDLGASWQINSAWKLQAQINNLTDRKYWRWSDVRGLSDSSTIKDAYSAPGRQFLLSLRYDFRSSHE